jgi:hypothetical protein
MLVRLLWRRSEDLLVVFAKKLEQFAGRTKPQFVAGIYFFHPAFEQPLFRICVWPKSNDERASHNTASLRERRNQGVAVMVSFWSNFGAERTSLGVG